MTAPDAPLFDLPAGTVYLDTAAQGPRLRSVLAAGHGALDASSAPWRLGLEQWQASIERVRALAAGCFDGDPEGVALVPSAAYGLAIAARNLPLAAGDAVAVLEGQFPSNLLCWQQRCLETGARLHAIPRNGPGWTDAVIEALDRLPSLRVLSLPHAYWHDGRLLDLDAISARCHQKGVALVLDLSQSLGALPADLVRWAPDFVVSVGHKWMLGPTGLAYLWASPHWRAHGVSIEHHWTARAVDDWRFPLDRPAPYRDGARRFDAGGVADPMRLSMAEAALGQLHDWGMASLPARLGMRTRALDTALRDAGLEGCCMPGHAPHFTGVRVPPDRMTAVAPVLDAAGIVCTRRHGVVRIAPHLHVDEAAMRRVADTLAAALHA
ncbi:aminotransferase class V-fold PLP-dependent enzyme [Lysobacter sp. A3-1-A15]|uniref:aminotransferase class V-fold PLP-dependent enzyme n=1 Tax=Novilysobacter viscosus TaxID=3098602 RepID=UPI002EDAA55B